MYTTGKDAMKFAFYTEGKRVQDEHYRVEGSKTQKKKTKTTYIDNELSTISFDGTGLYVNIGQTQQNTFKLLG